MIVHIKFIISASNNDERENTNEDKYEDLEIDQGILLSIVLRIRNTEIHIFVKVVIYKIVWIFNLSFCLYSFSIQCILCNIFFVFFCCSRGWLWRHSTNCPTNLMVIAFYHWPAFACWLFNGWIFPLHNLQPFIIFVTIQNKYRQLL